MNNDWKQEWKPMINKIGTDFSNNKSQIGADIIEKGAVRRYLEPLEFDCALHYNKKIAVKNGYKNIIAPYSSLLSWTIPPHWTPGEKNFTSSERNAQPARNPVSIINKDIAPNTNNTIVTEIEIDYISPIVVGDRLTTIGEKLISCSPKETRLGRGAFMTWESEVYNQLNELIAIIQTGTFNYNSY